MSRRWTRRSALAAAFVVGVALAAVQSGSAYAHDSSGSGTNDVQRSTNGYDWATVRDLLTVWSGTWQYNDINVALADGYVPGPVNEGICVQGPEGVRGYHYTNWERLLAPTLDFSKPPMLVYQPDGHGGMKLVAVEFYHTDADQDLSTNDDLPYFGSYPFKGPMEGHVPGMPIHYDTFVWAWQYNPAGLTADFNPLGSCEE
jgi:hypothetical protein